MSWLKNERSGNLLGAPPRVVSGRIVEIQIENFTWRHGRYGNTAEIRRQVGWRYYSNITRSSFRRLAAAVASLNDAHFDGGRGSHTRYGREDV